MVVSESEALAQSVDGRLLGGGWVDGRCLSEGKAKGADQCARAEGEGGRGRGKGQGTGREKEDSEGG